MATIHKATITPTKPEMLERLLGGSVTVLGAYRFDDPDGQVGVEAFVVSAGEALRHVVLTYRDAPLAGAEEHLISTMAHSVLGTRWVYDGQGDPVALACFRNALEGRQEQAVEEVWDSDEHVATREPTARVALAPGRPGAARAEVVIASDLEDSPPDVAGPRLRVTWADAERVVAWLA